MRSANLTRLAKWLAGLFVLAWLLGGLPVVPSPIGAAQAGFFDKAKGGKAQAEKSPSSAKSDDEKKVVTEGSAPPAKKSGGFFKSVKGPASAPSSSPAPQSQSTPQYAPQSKGGLFETVRTVPGPSRVPSPAGGAPPSARPRGGEFPSAPSGDDGWQRDNAVLSAIKSPPRGGWTSRGYFEKLQQAAEARRARDNSAAQYAAPERGQAASPGYYWYYPYDYYYYRWYRYHTLPIFAYPYVYSYSYAYPGYVYPGYVYPIYPSYPPALRVPDYAAPVVVVVEPNDWVEGETYIPYATWPSNDLMEAKRDIEQAWLHNRIELIERHLDADHKIECYLRDERTHSLSADEFRQLTLDAFDGIRTVSIEFSSVRYVSNADWARLKGKHVFTDPNDKRTTVYLDYLLHRIEVAGGAPPDSGAWRWVIWEVRQSPNPD